MFLRAIYSQDLLFPDFYSPKGYTFPLPHVSRPLSSQWLHIPRTFHRQASNFPRTTVFQDPIFPVLGPYFSRVLYSLDHILTCAIYLHGLIFSQPTYVQAQSWGHAFSEPRIPRAISVPRVQYSQGLMILMFNVLSV